VPSLALAGRMSKLPVGRSVARLPLSDSVQEHLVKGPRLGCTASAGSTSSSRTGPAAPSRHGRPRGFPLALATRIRHGRAAPRTDWCEAPARPPRRFGQLSGCESCLGRPTRYVHHLGLDGWAEASRSTQGQSLPSKGRPSEPKRLRPNCGITAPAPVRQSTPVGPSPRAPGAGGGLVQVRSAIGT